VNTSVILTRRKDNKGKRPVCAVAKCPLRVKWTLRRKRRADVPGQQFLNAIDGVVGDAGQHLPQVRPNGPACSARS